MWQKGVVESSLGTSWSSSEPFSSGLGTPFGSEIGSTETESEDDEDFMAELTRQMANYMLDENDEDGSSTQLISENSEKACDSPAKWSGCNPTSTYYCDQRFMSTSGHPATASLNIDVYQLKNQPPLKQERYMGLGSGAEMNEPAKQPKRQQLQNKRHHHHHHHRQNQMIGGHGGNNLSLSSGSGMRAVFLAGSGSRNGSSGTGVFFPRGVDNHQREPKMRLGCCSVLVPARVLQSLETHFSKMDTLSPSNNGVACPKHGRRGGNGIQHPPFLQGASAELRNSQLQTGPASSKQEMQLPEDWTY